MSMNSKLDCAEKVLRSHMDRYLVAVDRLADFIEAEDMTALENRIWLNVKLRYDLNQGLIIKSISSSKEIVPYQHPPLETFKDETEKYRKHGYVMGLFNKLNEDIQRTCLEI